MNERLYGMQDGNWNMVAICDTTGSVTERYAYSAYGAPVFMTGAGTVQTSSASDFETLYAGYRWDGGSPQMYYVRNRFLLPVTGTWNRRDPLGYVDGMNLTSLQDCILTTDPSGAWSDVMLDYPERQKEKVRQRYKKLEATIARMRKLLLECCKASPKPPTGSPSCEDGVDTIIKGATRVYNTINSDGGPVYRRPWGPGGWYCSRCVAEAEQEIHCGKYFHYEQVENLGISTHVWAQIRCRATGVVIGTVDFWKSLDDFFLEGRDPYPEWPGETHIRIDKDWENLCRTSRNCADSETPVLPPVGKENPNPYCPPKPIDIKCSFPTFGPS
jgi:hypothetical protein